MKTFYLFQIKKDIYNKYANNEYLLYKVLFNLYKLNKIDFSYGISLYKQLCDTIDVNRLKYYFELTENIRKGNNKYLIKDDKSLILLKPSRIIYQTNSNEHKVFYLINSFNIYFFACDFNSDEYFWIKNKINY